MGKQAIAVAQKRTPGRPPGKPETAPAHRPLVILVGNPRRTAKLKATLRKIDATIERMPDVESVADHLQDHTLAVVLVGPLPKLRLAPAVARLRREPTCGDVAIFALAPEGITGSEARRLYAAGATAVLEWPQEQFVFPQLLVELLAVDLFNGAMTEPNASLARTIRAHLKIVRGYSNSLRVRVDLGVAFISGTVHHLWQKERINSLVTDIPGVRSVVVRWLHVEQSERSSSQIRRSILRLLRDATDIDETTLAVTVEQGYVTLAGSVTDRQELNRVRKLLTNVKGVRNIERLTVVSPSQKQQDHVVARRLRNALANLFPEHKVHVSHFAGVAVLTGKVNRLGESQSIQAFIEDDDAVDRVVNKIEVTPVSKT
jgi:osmotically-inducible protein OsmY